MALELIKDTLKFDQIIGEGHSQSLVDKDIIVPDIKPDIARILSVEGKVNITGKNAEQDRVNVEGNVSFAILYSSGDDQQPVYSMDYRDNFSQYIDIPGAMPRMDTDIKCVIEHLEFNRVNGRKFNIQCVLNLKGKVIDRIPMDIIKEVSGLPDIQLLRDSVVTDEIVGENTAQTVVRGSIQIPVGVPSADELLRINGYIHKKDVSIEDGRVNITGCVLVPVLFSTRGDSTDLYKVEEDLLFSHTMELPGIAPDMSCNVEYNLDDITAELRENEDGEKRQIDVEAVVTMNVRVSQKNEYPVVIDMYAPSARIEPEKLSLSMDLFYGRNSSQAIIRESLQLPKGYPEIDKAYDMICRPAVTDCKVSDDKVIIEGVIGCDIIYLARSEGKIVHSFSDEVPFKTSVVVPGCRDDMKADVEIGIESMDFSVLTRNEIEIKVSLDCNVRTFENIDKEFVVKAEEIEEGIPPRKASITIYVVQPKDTLWKIAKRYYTTVEDISSVNEISAQDSIVPGLKLVIPRRVV